MRSWSELNLPPEGASANKLTERELAMATQLVDELTTKFKPEDYRDLFKAQVLALVDKKVKAGDTEAVIQPEEEPPGKSADIIDLTELLQRSLRGGGSKEGKGKRRKARRRAGLEVRPRARRLLPRATSRLEKGALPEFGTTRLGRSVLPSRAPGHAVEAGDPERQWRSRSGVVVTRRTRGMHVARAGR